MFREKQYPIDIPTWENGEWSYTTFYTMEEFKYFILGLFLEPGKYEFDEVSHSQFNEQARIFNKKGFYCAAPNRSRDFREYWNAEKEKCRMGAIYKNGSKTWYIPRDYYMWLNFLPIFDKEEGIYDFPKIWDIQYHMALYEILAELHYRHAAILKKRQMASSYYHCAKLVNQYWFESGAKLKMGASLKDYINEKGSWKMLQEYSDFLNKHTAWIRHHNPSKVGDWEQKISENRDGVEVNVGLMSTISGLTFEKEATKGVGGPCRIFFHEEGGIAPRAGDTYEYIRPALHSGMITTGLFIIAGSVGDLSQCEPLKEFMLKPEENGFYSVKSNLIDDKGTIGTHGLFLPEQWSMPPYIDEFGNSLVEEALAAIYEQRKQWKKDLTPEKYQLRVSQKPINIKEAFAYRDEAVFPLHILSAQEDRIDRKLYPSEFLDIRMGSNGKAEFIKTDKSPIREFPVSSSDTDKEGAIEVWERPSKDPKFGEYYASIDPVGEGKTTTSQSLCSIFIYKNSVQVTRMNENNEPEIFIEPGKIVASWCGRFDDINKTNERLELIIEIYNAWAIVENNISIFITHMQHKKKQKYLVLKDQMVFLKELNSNASVFSPYGWKNTGDLFKKHLVSYTIEYIREVIDEEFDENGNTLSATLGVERIPDPMLIREMRDYREGLNVDRLVAFAALVAFVKVQDANKGYQKRIEDNVPKLENSENLFKLKTNPFKHMGTRSKQSNPNGKFSRSPFKNIR